MNEEDTMDVLAHYIDDAFGGCPLAERPEECCGDRLDCASREQLKAEVVRLRGIHEGAVEAFRKYGQHRHGCDRRRDVLGSCDCGFDAALAAVGEQ